MYVESSTNDKMKTAKMECLNPNFDANKTPMTKMKLSKNQHEYRESIRVITKRISFTKIKTL